MPETIAHAEPAGTTAPSVTPAAGQPAASSLPQDADFAMQIERATTPAAIAALLRNLPKGAKPAAKPAAEALAETPAAEATPAAEEPAEPADESLRGEETPPTETPAETPAEPGETEEPAEPNEADRDKPVTPSTARKIGLRLPEKDELGRLATAFMRRNVDWTLEQAMEAAKAQLGIKPSSPAASETPAKPADPELPATIEELDRKSMELEEKLEKAAEALDTVEEAKIHRQLRKLDRHRLTLQQQTIQEEATSHAAYNREFDASQTRAIEIYPFAGDPNSEGGKLMVEIEKALEETQDARFHHPNKPYLVAQMAAAELGIAPRRKGAPAAPAKPAASVPATPGPKKGVLPSGSSRTTVPAGTNPNGEFVKAISAAKTPLELRQATEKLGLKLPGM